MVGLAELSGAIGGLKAALDIVQGLKSTADAVAINNAKIGLQGAIIEAQGGLMAAQEARATHLNRIRELEQRIADFENWEREKERYTLIEIYDGSYPYVPKPPVEAGGAHVSFCTSCFDQRKKAILQRQGSVFQVGGGKGMQIHWRCSSCLTSIDVPQNLNPARVYEMRGGASQAR